MKTETKTLLFLIVLGLVDMVIPIPITAAILIYALLAKPPWFAELVRHVYETQQGR